MCTFEIGQSVIIHSSYPDSFLYGQLGTITEIDYDAGLPYTVEYIIDNVVDHSYFYEDELVPAK